MVEKMVVKKAGLTDVRTAVMMVAQMAYYLVVEKVWKTVDYLE